MKNWFYCPKCGQKLLKYEDGAVCAGVFIKCKGKNCGQEIEIKINKEMSH